MGWKSTVELKRETIIGLIASRIVSSDVTDDELTNVLDSLGFGDNRDLPLYGYNFRVGSQDECEIIRY